MTKHVWLAAILLGLGTDGVAGRQWTSPPPQMAELEFLVGEWQLTGRFRLPDYQEATGRMWYRTLEGGVIRFDGTGWLAFARGDDALADSVLTLTAATGDRKNFYDFETTRRAFHTQDGYAITIDDGSTGGQSVVYYDTAERVWVFIDLHAPTNAPGTGTRAELVDGVVTATGTATDRRGERLFRTTYRRVTPDRYVVTTDASFDGGRTWIEEQLVNEVVRINSH